jgi:arylsulfatase A
MYRQTPSMRLTHFCLFALLPSCCCLSLKAQPQQPNILFILTDDQGTLDLHCYGAADLHTPHLDALAAEGIRFTRFYAAAPLCSPSRAALLTGKNPHAAGLPGNASSLPGQAGMPAEQLIMPAYFKELGYRTAHIGKWHLGYSEATRPLAKGFDYSFGHMGGCIDNYSHFFYWDGPNRHDLWEGEEEVFFPGQYFPDLMLAKAKRFISAQLESPFFLYFALNTPHVGFHPPRYRAASPANRANNIHQRLIQLSDGQGEIPVGAVAGLHTVGDGADF